MLSQALASLVTMSLLSVICILLSWRHNNTSCRAWGCHRSYGQCPKFHRFFYGFPEPCGRKLKEQRYTQPLYSGADLATVLFSHVVESWKCKNTRNLSTVVSCSATQEIELFHMWLVTLCSEPWELCQLCVGLRPGSNWPIPALSLLVKASPVWLDKPCLGCFPLGPSSLGKHCLQCEWGSLSRCRSAQLYYKPSFTGTCTGEKENPTVMALAPRFDRGLSVVRIFYNFS